MISAFSDYLLLSGVTLFSICIPWFYGLTLFHDKLAAQVFIFFLFLIFLPKIKIQERLSFNLKHFDGWITAGSVLVLLYVGFSILPYRSLLVFSQWLSACGFYFLVCTLSDSEKKILFFLTVIVLIGVFYSAYGLGQYWGYLPHGYWYQPTGLASRYVNGAHFSAFLLFPLFAALSLLVSSRKFWIRGLLLCGLLLMMWVLILTRARAVWLAFFAGICIFVWLLRPSKWKNKNFMLTLAAWVIFFSVFFIFGGWNKISARLAELNSNQYFSLFQRLDIWKGAWLAIWNRPWGWGLGTFQEVFPHFRVHADRFLIDYAHNEFLQMGTELGLAGVIFLAAFIFFFTRQITRFVRQAEGLQQQAIGAGFAALWASWLLAVQVDFPLRIYATSFFFFLFLALTSSLMKLSSAPKAARGKIGLLIQGGIFVLVFFALFLTARQLQAESHFLQASKAEKNFEWPKAIAEYQHAVESAPLDDRYHEALAFLYYKKSGVSFNREQRKQFYEIAISEYQRAIRLNPYKAGLHYFLARLYEETGNLEQAQSEFKKAIEMDPLDGLFISEYGYFAIRHSLTADAVSAFERLYQLKFWGAARSDSCEVLRKIYPLTQDYSQLKRAIPDAWEGHYCLATVLGENGQWEFVTTEFAKAFEQAKKIFQPDFYQEHVQRAAEDFLRTHDRQTDILEMHRREMTFS